MNGQEFEAFIGMLMNLIRHPVLILFRGNTCISIFTTHCKWEIFENSAEK